MIISETQVLLRLLVSTLLGAMIGFERERQNQPAGLRTHTILCVGSALAMTLSINIAGEFRDWVPGGDPARLAAQVISGIGFLGGGAILRYGDNIRGLTTASSLWTLAIIGLTVGAGHYRAAVTTTVILLVVLTVLNYIEKRFVSVYNNLNIELQIDDRPGILNEIRQALADQNTKILSISIARNLEQDVASFTVVVKTKEEAHLEDMVQHLTGLKGIKSFKIS